MYLNHPRYGDKPIITNTSSTIEAIENAHWRYSSLKYFPNTVILADIKKQNYAIYPRALYVDIEEKCGTCSKAFIFLLNSSNIGLRYLGRFALYSLL